jgi:F-type H+-transporting ATPase subunit c
LTASMIFAIVVGVICLGSSFAAAFGDAKVISTAIEGMARQPEVQGQLLVSMLIGSGLVEAVPIISIVMAFILLGRI